MKRSDNEPSPVNTTPEHLFREKRKWQIALRRYILEQQKSLTYAPYFGLDNSLFRQWIAAQFDQDMQWENFSDTWQFDHVVPVAYFDFTNEKDLRLCWNFTNIRAAKIDKTKEGGRGIDVLGAKRFFQNLFQQTGYAICSAMVEKINRLEEAQAVENAALAGFINQHKPYLDAVNQFSPAEFERLNTGTPLQVLLSEKEFLKKFGG
jgi:hypothetical protein